MELQQQERIAELEARLAEVERERDHFKALFDQAPAFMASLMGSNYVYTYSNPLNNQLLGHREMLGKPLAEAFEPAEAAALLPLLDHVYATGEPIVADELETVLQRDGRLETIYVNGVYQPIRDAEGRVQGVLSHAIDVTDQVLARRGLLESSAQLERSEARFRQLAESIPQIVWVNNMERQLEFLNQQWVAYTGATAAESQARGWADFIHPEDMAALRPLFQAYLTRGEEYEFEYRLRRHDGVYRWHLGRCVPEKDVQGAVIRWIGTGTDIHDLKEAQSSLLQRSEAEKAAHKAMTERIITHVNAGINYIDRDFIFRWVNPTFLRIFGLPAEHLLNRSVFEAFPEAEVQVGPLLRRVLETGEPFQGESFPFTYGLDGRTITHYWDFVYQPVFDEHGVVEGVLTFATEVTDRVEKERLQAEWIETLRRADRMKDEFLSVVSHELRTPLNFIMGFASILDDELHGPLNPAQKHDVERILAGSERMLRLVNDLLDVAKIQAGRLEVFLEPTPVDELVREVVSSLEPLAAPKPVALVTDIQVEIPPRTDRPRMTQVLTNLVSNAIKFTPGGGRVDVRAYEAPGTLVMEVADTGIGIAEEQLPRLFQRFQQLDMSATREVGGTGLGLVITKAIVEAHGGRLEVESTPQQGSLFRVVLPHQP